MAGASEITAVQIGVNYYAPAGSNAVNLYQTKTSEPLTLSQLIAAVTLRIAAACELRSINQLNRLNNQSMWSTALSKIISYLTANESKWTDNIWDVLPEGYSPKNSGFTESTATLKNFFLLECEIDESSLPANLESMTDRLDAYEQIKPIAESSARVSQQLQVEVKSSTGRRDIAYATSSNAMESLFTSMNYSATSMRG